MRDAGVPLWNSALQKFSMRCRGLELGVFANDLKSSTVELSAIRRGRSLDLTGGNLDLRKFHGGTLALQPSVMRVHSMPRAGTSILGSGSTVDLFVPPDLGVLADDWKVPPWNFGPPAMGRGAGAPLWNSSVREFSMRAGALNLVFSSTIGRVPPWNFGLIPLGRVFVSRRTGTGLVVKSNSTMEFLMTKLNKKNHAFTQRCCVNSVGVS